MKPQFSFVLGFDRLDARAAALIFLGAVALGFATPWWSFVLIAAGFSAYRTWTHATHYTKRDAWVPGLLIALAWITVAFVRDVTEGGRVSARLAMIFQLPSRVLLYVAVFAVVALLSALAGWTGRLWVRSLAEGKGED